MSIGWAVLTGWEALLLAGFGLWWALVAALALGSRRRPAALPDPERWPRFLVIVPAHDEEAMIAGTVGRILALDYPRDRFTVCVVADNCGDRTAARAREAGAECLERVDPERRGKGYALQFALDALKDREADVVLFLDADSYPALDYLTAMARHWGRGEAVVQGCYEARSLRDTWFARLTAMSFRLRNRWVFPALYRWGWPLPLRGSGMAFATAILRETGWGAHGLTEDLEMTLTLLRHGHRATFAATAVCGQYMPATPAEAGTQRRRWSAGERAFRRALLVRDLPRALGAGRWGWAGAFVYLALPGLSAQWAGLLVLTGVAAYLGGGWLWAALVMCALHGSYFLLGLPRWDAKHVLTLAVVPVYAAWRLGQALASRRRRGGGEWVRTDRPAAAEDAEPL